MKFVLVTEDFSGLGFAIRLQDEGHQVVVAFQGSPEEMNNAALRPRFETVGNGIASKVPLANVLTERDRRKDAYFIWDGNHHVEENELLRKEGFKVFGGGRFADQMEHDRAGAARLMARYGLDPPPTFRFARPRCAVDFLRARPGTAYVFKPDHGESCDTWVPRAGAADEANRALQQHLQNMAACGPFVLQEFVDGVETNVEVWFVRGLPRFAVMAVENKRKLQGESGELAGCAFDFVFPIPLESKVVQESIAKLYPLYRRLNYTGFGDANVIWKDGKLWFLEKCERLGYNAHPNFFWNLNRRGVGETIAALVEGTFQPDCGARFGASVTMYSNQLDPECDIRFPKSVYEHLYFWDVKDDSGFRRAGYDYNVLIAMASGDTMESAWTNVMATAAQVHFPHQGYRTDGGQSDYAASPVRRYEALRSLDYL